MTQLRVQSPVALPLELDVEPASRARDLSGRRIGLYWNIKAGGDVALRHARKLIEERYEGASFVDLMGSVGVTMRHLTDEDAEHVVATCDAVVGTTGDCGSCTSWLVRDMVLLEGLGIPTVAYVSETFVDDARHSAETFGLRELPLVVVPAPFTNQSPDGIDRMVDGSFDQLLAGLTAPPNGSSPAGATVVFPSSEELTYDGDDQLGALEAMNDEYLENGWSDGFPLVAATDERVRRMLTGTSRDPESLVAVLEPGFGRATVEKIAVNAVMAGCRPSHLPVIIAAVEALADPQMYLRTKAMSTGPAAPLVLVNGPIVDRIGINTGVCALGPGSTSYVNTVIGRAVRLCMMNLGHTYPGISDLDTVGTPAKYSLCVGENEGDSPWVPYHVDQGFDPQSSVVTVQFIYGLCDLFDFQSYEAEPLVDVFASALQNAALASAGMWMLGRRGDPRHGTEEQEHDTILLAPEHAEIFAEAGWSRADLQTRLHREARVAFGTLIKNKEPEGVRTSHPELAWLFDAPETPVPVLESPECYDLAVVGGAAGRSTVMWGMGGPVTKPIDEER